MDSTIESGAETRQVDQEEPDGGAGRTRPARRRRCPATVGQRPPGVAWCAHQRAELARGQGVCDEDAARLSPLKAKKVNVLGRYAIVASQPAEGLRPLLDPANPGDKDMLD